MRPGQMSAAVAHGSPAAALRDPRRRVSPAPIQVSLAAGVASAGAARAAVRAWMAGHVTEPCSTDALLIVGELVCNSIRHAQAPPDATIDVRAEMRGDAVLLEVVDGGTSGTVVRRPPDLRGGGGFGLNVVDVLSRRWGVDRGARTRVWAELPVAATA